MKNLSFKEASNILATIPNIAKGGCGIMALSLWRVCQKTKRKPQNIKLVTLYGNHDHTNSFNVNLDFINKDGEDAQPCWHFAFIVNNMIIDQSGPVDMQYYQKMLIVPIEKTEQFLIKAVNNHGWNEMFDREEFVPKIAQLLNINLNDVKLDTWNYYNII